MPMTDELNKIIEELPTDRDEAIERLVKFFDAMMSDTQFEGSIDQLEASLPFYTALYAVLDNDDNNSEKICRLDPGQVDQDGYLIFKELDFDQETEYVLRCIHDYINHTRDRNLRRISSKRFASIVNQTKTAMGKIPYYKFDQEEVERIQEILNKLREEVTRSDIFQQDHKRRIFMRLESLQQEIHKRLSDLDRFWGLIGDAGIALGKFGKDARPFAELIKELTQVVWKAQARSEEVSSEGGPPLISGPE